MKLAAAGGAVGEMVSAAGTLSSFIMPAAARTGSLREEISLHFGKVMKAGLGEDKPICRLTLEGVICGPRKGRGGPRTRRHKAKPKWAEALPQAETWPRGH